MVDISGEALQPGERNKSCAIDERNDMKHASSKRGAGCDITRNHIEAYRRLMRSAAPWAFIVEDDIQLHAPVSEIARQYSR